MTGIVNLIKWITDTSGLRKAEAQSAMYNQRIAEQNVKVQQAKLAMTQKNTAVTRAAYATETEAMTRLQAQQAVYTAQIAEQNKLLETRAAIMAGMSGIAGAAGKGMILGGVAMAGVVAAPLLIAKSQASLSDALWNTVSILHGSEEMYSDLSDAAWDMAKKYGGSVDTIANGMYFMASSGMELNEILEELEKLTQMSVAGNMDLETSIRAVIVAQTAFNDEQLSTIDISDKMLTAMNNTMGTMDDVTAFMQRSAGAAAALGLSMDETLSMYSAVSPLVDAEKAGTATTRLLSVLAQNYETLKPYITDVNGELLDMGTVMLNLGNYFDQHESELAGVGAVYDEFGIRAGTMFLNMSQNMERYITTEGDMRDSSGETMSQLADHMKSLTRIFEMFQNILLAPLGDETFLLRMGEAITDMTTALENSNYAALLQEILLSMVKFVEERGVEFINMLLNILTFVSNLMPMVINLANGFMNLMNTLGQTFIPLLKIFLLFKMLTWIAPNLAKTVMFTGNMFKYAAKNSTYLSQGMHKLQNAMYGAQGLIGGFMIISMSGNDMIGVLMGAATIMMSMIPILYAINTQLGITVKLWQMLGIGLITSLAAWGFSQSMPDPMTGMDYPTSSGGTSVVTNNYDTVIYSPTEEDTETIFNQMGLNME